MDHKQTCQALQERRALTHMLADLTTPRLDVHVPVEFDGSEKQLNERFDVLKGIVAEYQDNGDQILENCTCADPYGQAITEIAQSLRKAFENEGQMSSGEHKNLVDLDEIVHRLDNS